MNMTPTASLQITLPTQQARAKPASTVNAAFSPTHVHPQILHRHVRALPDTRPPSSATPTQVVPSLCSRTGNKLSERQGRGAGRAAPPESPRLIRVVRVRNLR